MLDRRGPHGQQAGIKEPHKSADARRIASLAGGAVNFEPEPSATSSRAACLQGNCSMLNQLTRTLSTLALVAFLARSAMSADWTTTGNAVALRKVADLPLGELINKTAGGISDKGLSNFPSFDEYWRANEVSRVGKTYEACDANTANLRFQAVADPPRLVPTAALNQVHDKADLLLVDGGRLLARVQSKLGLRELEDARYACSAVPGRRSNLAVWKPWIGAARFQFTVNQDTGMTAKDPLASSFIISLDALFPKRFLTLEIT